MPRLNRNTLVVFFTLTTLDNLTFRLACIEWVETLSKSIGAIDKNIKLKVIFHNGDIVPNIDFYKSIIIHCDEVFSVNINDYIPGVIAIPIGLENIYHQNNGLLKDFMTHKNLSFFQADHKSHYVYSSFKIDTNPLQREPLMRLIKQSRHKFTGREMTLPLYRKAISEHFFIISPQGNGMDCHRTWEAIALGSIPVLKRGSLADSLAKNLPIHLVDDWTDFLSLSDIELENLYYSYKEMPIDKALMPYWYNRIFGC